MEEKVIRAAGKAYDRLVADVQADGLEVDRTLSAFAWRVAALPGFDLRHLESVYLLDNAGKRKWLVDRGMTATGRLAHFMPAALDHAAVYLLAQEAMRARQEADRLRNLLVGCKAA